jgi:hypothetical protein
MKNMRSIATVVCFAFMLLFALSAADSQTIALHPLKGNYPDVAKMFFAEIVKAMDEFPGTYTTYLINLEDDESLDVSSGGMPAYICPQNVLTKGSPFALTGEVTGFPDNEGMYEIRLYLWEMEHRALLVSDGLVVYEGETEAKYLPQLLAWMLSWIDRVKFYTPTEDVYIFVEKEVIIEPEIEIVYVEREVIIEPEIQGAPEEPYWLHLGLRLGGGDSMWHFIRDDGFNREQYVIHFLNGGIGVQAAVNLLPWFAIQPEINFAVDLSRPWDKSDTDGTFVSSYLTLPILFKFNWYKNNLMASIFTGPYFYLPLFRTGNASSEEKFNYKPQIPGFIFGGNIGWKIGPGFLFADARFEYDGHFLGSSASDSAFYRNVVKISIGYELPFFKKTPKGATARTPVERPLIPNIPVEEEEWSPAVLEDEIPTTNEEEQE